MKSSSRPPRRRELRQGNERRRRSGSLQLSWNASLPHEPDQLFRELVANCAARLDQSCGVFRQKISLIDQRSTGRTKSPLVVLEGSVTLLKRVAWIPRDSPFGLSSRQRNIRTHQTD